LKTIPLLETIQNLEKELEQQIHQFEAAFKLHKYGEIKVQIQNRIIWIQKRLRVLDDERREQLLQQNIVIN